MNKRKLRSTAVGFFSMLFIDSLARIIFTIYHGIDFPPFSYAVFPGYLSYIMLGISVLGAFFGAMMVITLSGRKWFPFLAYILILALWRLSPLILVPSEPQWIVYTATAFTVIAAFGSRQFIVDKKIPETEDEPEGEIET